MRPSPSQSSSSSSIPSPSSSSSSAVDLLILISFRYNIYHHHQLHHCHHLHHQRHWCHLHQSPGILSIYIIYIEKELISGTRSLFLIAHVPSSSSARPRITNNIWFILKTFIFYSRELLPSAAGRQSRETLMMSLCLTFSSIFGVATVLCKAESFSSLLSFSHQPIGG